MVAVGESRRGAQADGLGADGVSADGKPAGDAAILATQITRFVEELVHLARIRAARQRVRIQRAVVLSAAGVLAVILAGAIGLRGVDLLARGVSGGLMAAFANNPWLGELTGGLALLGITALGVFSMYAASRSAVARKLHRHLTMGAMEARAEVEPFGKEEARAIAELKATLTKAGADLRIQERLGDFVRRDPELALACAAAIGALVAPLALKAAKFSVPMLLRWAKSAAMPGPS